NARSNRSEVEIRPALSCGVPGVAALVLIPDLDVGQELNVRSARYEGGSQAGARRSSLGHEVFNKRSGTIIAGAVPRQRGVPASRFTLDFDVRGFANQSWVKEI